MSKQYRYYLGRITKGGALTTNELIEAIIEPVIIRKKEYSYTFTNMFYDKENNYVYGKLVKFMLEGEVETIEPEKHKESSMVIPHKKESSSPFIIVLDYMGIAYPHIWNSLLKEQFVRYFCDLICEKYHRMLVSCKIEPVVDLRTFVERVASIDTVHRISATVVPPNPLFGPAWKELKEYMEERDSGEISINEKAKTTDGINTELVNNMKSILTKNRVTDSEKIMTLENQKYGISDAAILMAADGYGKAKIEGSINNEKVTIKTKDNQKSFLFDKDPDKKEFFEYVKEEFKMINEERYLEH